MNANYLNAARLLLEVAPAVFRYPLFALKGGTAINLFVRDMPRLSVDLDLAIAWNLMTCAHLRDMPAIRWKLDNLSRLKQSNPEKFALQANELGAKL